MERKLHVLLLALMAVCAVAPAMAATTPGDAGLTHQAGVDHVSDEWGLLCFDAPANRLLDILRTADTEVNPGSGGYFGPESLDGSERHNLSEADLSTSDKALRASKSLQISVIGQSVGSVIEVFLPNGDCDGNGIIDLADFAIVDACYGASPGDPNWNANADLDGDGIVGDSDFAIVNANFDKRGDE